jgi:hypothetical protein
MTLLIKAVLSSLQDVAAAHGLKDARVDYKVNRAGEIVFAIIVPAPEGEPDNWRDHVAD